jgi:hypothetical protein
LSNKKAKAASAPKKGAGGVLGAGGARPPADKQTPAQRFISSVAAMREALARNPQATVADIDAALKKRGIDKPLATISTIRSDFMGCYRATGKGRSAERPGRVEVRGDRQ